MGVGDVVGTAVILAFVINLLEKYIKAVIKHHKAVKRRKERNNEYYVDITTLTDY